MKWPLPSWRIALGLIHEMIELELQYKTCTFVMPKTFNQEKNK